MWTEDILNHLEAAGVGTCGDESVLGPVMPDEPEVRAARCFRYPGSPSLRNAVRLLTGIWLSSGHGLKFSMAGRGTGPE